MKTPRSPFVSVKELFVRVFFLTLRMNKIFQIELKIDLIWYIMPNKMGSFAFDVHNFEIQVTFSVTIQSFLFSAFGLFSFLLWILHVPQILIMPWKRKRFSTDASLFFLYNLIPIMIHVLFYFVTFFKKFFLFFDKLNKIAVIKIICTFSISPLKTNHFKYCKWWRRHCWSQWDYF